jgi:hypothetical protein
MSFNYPPPSIIHYVEENHACRGAPFFYEYNGRILNLAAATGFYVDHLPLTTYYWPCVKIGSNTYYLSASMSSEEEAMRFLRDLVERIEGRDTKNPSDPKQDDIGRITPFSLMEKHLLRPLKDYFI